jgi:hypothetical protein
VAAELLEAEPPEEDPLDRDLREIAQELPADELERRLRDAVAELWPDLTEAQAARWVRRQMASWGIGYAPMPLSAPGGQPVGRVGFDHHPLTS